MIENRLFSELCVIEDAFDFTTDLAAGIWSFECEECHARRAFIINQDPLAGSIHKFPAISDGRFPGDLYAECVVCHHNNLVSSTDEWENTFREDIYEL